MSPGPCENRWSALICSLLAFFLSGEATVRCLKTFVLSCSLTCGLFFGAFRSNPEQSLEFFS